jgi:hypothetical protein
MSDGDAPVWAVERVLQAAKWKNRRSMLVKWVGYREPTWIWRANLTLTDAFKDFVKKYGEGDDVGEVGTGSYTGTTGKVNKGKLEEKV